MATDVPTIHFRDGVGGVAVDVTRLVSSRLLCVANSGGGKSRALRYMLEQTHGQVQHVVIDPEGEFASLREKFPYLLVGKDGDVPANPKAAKLLARRVMELGASAVIDLYELPLADRRRFVRLFLEELMHLPRSLWHPALIVVDEAHVFAPERGSGEAESTEAVIALATQGRKRGYALVAATQRLSKLHKDVAAELLNKMIGRTGLDVDVKRAGDELGFDKEQRAALKHMAPGTFWVYGPAITNEVTLVRTGDVQTTHPEAGAIGAAAPPAPAAVARLVEQLRDLPREAEEEARTVEELQKLTRQLKADLRRAQSAAPAPVVDQTAIDAAYRRGEIAAQVRAAKLQREAVKTMRGLVSGVERCGEILSSQIAAGLKLMLTSFENVTPAQGEPATATPIPHPAPRRPAETAPSVPAQPTRQRTPSPAVVVDPAALEGLGGTPRRMLEAMALLEQLGIEQPTRANVAGFLGISHNTGTFRNNLSQLRVAGLIEDCADQRITRTGTARAAIPSPDRPPTLDELHDIWRGKLGGTTARMMDVIIAAYPEPISRAAIAEQLGVDANTGTFRNNLSLLRSPGLIRDVTKGGDVIATDLLFPEGLV